MSKTMKWNEIVSKSNTVKVTVESNRKIPSFDGLNAATLLEILCKSVLNPGKNIVYENRNNAKDPTGTGINKKLNKTQYKDVATRCKNFISKNKKAPNYITFGSDMISVRLATYCLSKIVLSYDSKKKLPDEMLFDNNVFYAPKKYGHATKKGKDNMGQNTGYFCACHSLQEVIRNLYGIVVPQSTIASWCGTTTSGTSHQGIRTGVAAFNKRYDKNLKMEEKSFSELGWNGIKNIVKSNNQDCIIHNLYRNKYGHYEVVNNVDSTVNVQNSLGEYCSYPVYCGYIEYRSQATFRSYINGISQKSVLLFTRG